MKQKEIVWLSIGVFLTMVAFVINSIYHIENGVYINQEILPVSASSVHIDPNIFTILKEKN